MHDFHAVLNLSRAIHPAMPTKVRSRKHRNDYNHGKGGFIGGNPRYGGKCVSNFRGWSAKNSRHHGKVAVREAMEQAAIDEQERIRDAAAQIVKDAIKVVSQGQWRVEVSTQILENRGSRIKCAGGCEYQIAFDTRPTGDQINAAIGQIAAAVTHHDLNGGMYCYDESVVHTGVYAPDEETPGEYQIRDMFAWRMISEGERHCRLAALRKLSK